MTITVSDASALDITGAITIETWAKLERNTEGVHALIGKDNCYGIAVGQGDSNNVGFVGKVGDGTSINYTIEDTQVWIDGTWHHFAFTFTDNGRARLYVDGVRTEKDDSLSKSLGTNASDLLMGEWSGQSWTMQGVIDEVRLWSEERTESQIANNRFVGLSGSETNLNGYWSLDNGSGSTIEDKTANNNDGTLASDGSWVQRSVDNQGFFRDPLGESDVGLSQPVPATITNSDTYDSKGGATRANIEVEVPALQRKAKYQRVLIRRQGSTEWQSKAELQNRDNPKTVSIEELSPTIQWEVATRSYSMVNSETITVEATNSPFSTSGDTTAPSWSTHNLSVQQGTGKAVRLNWDANDANDLDEYGVYRNVNGTSFGNASKIAEIRSTEFIDSDVNFNDTFNYWVVAIDGSNNESTESSRVSISPSPVPSDEVDRTDPSNPSKPGDTTLNSSVYTADDDGTIRAKANYDPPSVPSDAEYVNILLRRDAESKWETVASNVTTTNTRTINDLAPDTAYELVAVSVNFSGQTSGVSTIANVSTPAKGDAPGAPDNLTLSDKTGRAIELNWDKRSEKDLGHYSVYRNTTNDFSTATLKNEEVKDIRWTDTDFNNNDYGTTFHYWVTATDTSGNESTESSGKSEKLNEIPSDDVDSSQPQKPPQPSTSNANTYIADDGGVRSEIDVTMNGLTNLAKYQNILIRKSGASEWQIAAQRKNDNQITVPVDDLTPGIGYEVAVQSYSYSGVPSNISDKASFTADTKNTDPADVQNFTETRENGSVRLTWDAVPDNDLKYYEIRKNKVGSGKNWSQSDIETTSVSTSERINLPDDDYNLLIKAVDTSGNESTNEATTTAQMGNRLEFTSTGNHSYTIPNRVNTIEVTLVGGGGGGGGGDDDSGANGGGGGETVINQLIRDVSPGDTIDINVASGGSGGSYQAGTGVSGEDGSDGGNSFITTDNNKTITAFGGSGGQGGGGGLGAGGQHTDTKDASGTTAGNDVPHFIRGGDGDSPDVAEKGGGGGASAFGPGGDGAGGAGSPGAGGNKYGGAGGGGGEGSGGDGGDGAQGIVIIKL